jgi:hypothetical protein
MCWMLRTPAILVPVLLKIEPKTVLMTLRRMGIFLFVSITPLPKRNSIARYRKLTTRISYIMQSM